MKFQKGLLDDLKQPASEKQVTVSAGEKERSAFNEKDHLFETQEGWSRSSRHYLKLLGVVAVFVAIAGVGIAYMTLPSVGDQVRGPKGLEPALYDHFLVTEKRTATDMAFYYCGTFYWARVTVEKRPDIKTNPIYLIDRYTARAAQREDGNWAITASPANSPEADVPCS